MKNIIVLLGLFFCLSITSAQDGLTLRNEKPASQEALPVGNERIAREDVEWLDVWIPDSNNHGLPRVLLVGNSITRSYYNEVANQLKGTAYVARLTTSKSVGDPALLAEIRLIMSYLPFDVVHFNNGLHGWDYTEEEYKNSFPDMIRTIRECAPDAKLIWATTTPIRQGAEKTEFDPRTERVIVRNQIALKCIEGQDIALDDLFKLVENHTEYYAGGDGTHFVPVGVSALATQVSSVIKEIIEKK